MHLVFQNHTEEIQPYIPNNDKEADSLWAHRYQQHKVPCPPDIEEAGITLQDGD